MWCIISEITQNQDFFFWNGDLARFPHMFCFTANFFLCLKRSRLGNQANFEAVLHEIRSLDHIKLLPSPNKKVDIWFDLMHRVHGTDDEVPRGIAQIVPELSPRLLTLRRISARTTGGLRVVSGIHVHISHVPEISHIIWKEERKIPSWHSCFRTTGEGSKLHKAHLDKEKKYKGNCLL